MSVWPSSSKQAETSFGALSRSALMARIRSSRNATTELRLIGLMREAKITGWRRQYSLLGKPDFVFRAARLVVFVDGCFWHGHGCGRNLSPKTNASLWAAKILRNRARDRTVTRKLRTAGWRVFRVWECELATRGELWMRRIRNALKKPL